MSDLTEKNKKQRLIWIDVAKGIAIILVVYRHIMIGISRAGLEVSDYYYMANDIVFTFRMPLFFILSGLFIEKSIQKKGNLLFIKERFNRLFYPFIVWAFIQVSIQIILSNYTNSQRSLIDYWYIISQPRNIDQFWFLYALFNVSILYLVLYKNVKSKYLNVLIGIVLCIISTNFILTGIINDLFYYLIFTVLGATFSYNILEGRIGKILESKIFFIFLTPAFIISQLLWIEGYVGKIGLVIVSLIGCTYLISFSIIFCKKRALKYLAFIGKYSLYIYLLHVIISGAFRIVLINWLHIENVEILLILGITMGTSLPIIFYRLIKNTKLKYLFHFG